MMEKTKSAPVVGATETENVNRANGKESSPHDTILPQVTTQGKQILQHIRAGRENAIPRSDLIKVTGMRDRMLRLEIEAMRRAGVVILADVVGYYLPGDLDEVQAFIRQESSRARSTFFTLRSARKLAEQMQAQGEQIRIEGAG